MRAGGSTGLVGLLAEPARLRVVGALVELVGGTLGVLETDGSTDAAAAWWARDALGADQLTPYAAAVLAGGRLRAG